MKNFEKKNGIYVPIHCHTEHSLLDGLSRPAELAHRAKEIGAPACAITDHGAMSGCLQFYKACQKEGIIPILGMEAYMTPYGHSLSERVPYDQKELRNTSGKGHQRNNYHAILLCKDYTGYKNLCALHTASYAAGYYYKPRIDFELLKEHHEGLIFSNACFTPGQKVIVKSDGDNNSSYEEINIEDVKAGQFVLTHKGRWRRVIEPTSRMYDGDGYSIIVENQSLTAPIECTANHKFFVFDSITSELSWKAAVDIASTDYLTEPYHIEDDEPQHYFLKKIESKKRIHINQRVHCLNVEEDHSFVCGGVAVHNCVLGEVNHHLLHGDYDMARDHALRLQDLFGEDYYFEIMNHGLEMEIAIMPHIRELAKELGIKVIATNDSHFTYKEDHKLQRTMMLLGMHKSWADADVAGSFFEDMDVTGQKNISGEDGDSDPIFSMPASLYVKTYDEMMEALCLSESDIPFAEEELANTLEIAKKCNCELPIIDPNDMSQYHTPLYAINKDLQFEDYETSHFELRDNTVSAVLDAMHAAGKEGDTLQEVLTEHEYDSLLFLMWMCEKGIEERIKPKIEARGEPLPIEFYMKNPPKGFAVTHKHNSPDESFIKGNLSDGKTPEDIIQMYRDRLDYEVSIVCRKGFLDYFSIVQQYCNHARFHDNPPGPGRGCLTDDNLVWMEGGVAKPISDVKIGDVVFDEKGIPSRVLNTYEYDVDEELRKITVYNSDDLVLTSDHKVKVSPCIAHRQQHCENETDGGTFPQTDPIWLPASEIKPGDWVYSFSVEQDGFIPIQVKGNEPYRHVGKVYDLMIDTKNEPSYVTTSCVVHNSGAGALLNYLLGITSVDPLPNKLIFERFLNPDRVGYPDIDVDFNKAYRDEILKPYLREEYGEDNAAGVSTFTYAWGKAAIKAAARVLFNPPESVQWADDLCKLIDDHPKLDLNSELQDEGGNEALKQLIRTGRHYQQIIDLALMLQGRIIGTSIHASAFILSPFKITDKMPLTVPKAERERVQATGESVIDFLISYDGVETQESLGFVKLDLLCIKDLEVLSLTMRIIERVYGCKIDIESIPMDDAAVFQMLEDHLVSGIFQLDGSSGMAQVMDDVTPQSIEEINAVIALFRPGPMDYIPNYVNGKWHPETVSYLDPRLEPILKDTYGVCSFQEQAMQITQVIGGFTGGQADNYRKQAAKKHMDQLVLIKDDFIKGALENDTAPEVADALWEQLVKFGSYAFNRSHSAAYAYIAYRGGFLKAHFPECFLAAMCTIKPMMKKTLKVPAYLEEARQMGVQVKPPHVNYSMEDFDVPEKGVIAFGLGGIKRVGKGAAPIIAEREKNGPFKDFTDFCTRVPKEVGKAPIEALIKAGALDGLGWSRMAMEESIDQIVAFRKDYFREKSKRDLFEDDLFGFGDSDDSEDSSTPDIILVPPFDTEYSELALMRKEREEFGLYFDKDPRDFCQVSRFMLERELREHSDESRKSGNYDAPIFVNVKEIPDLPDKTHVGFIANVDDFREFNTKKGKRMASMFVWDNGTGEESRFGFAPVKAKVKCTIFSSVLATIAKPMPDDVVYVTGRVSVDQEGKWPTAVLVDTIELVTPDSQWLGSGASIEKMQEFAQAQADMRAYNEEVSNPASKRYMIPAISFKTTDDMRDFCGDLRINKLYLKEGNVQVSAEDDPNGDNTKILHLKQTMGTVKLAAEYGGIAKKIRHPKAARALARKAMLEGKTVDEIESETLQANS